MTQQDPRRAAQASRSRSAPGVHWPFWTVMAGLALGLVLGVAAGILTHRHPQCGHNTECVVKLIYLAFATKVVFGLTLGYALAVFIIHAVSAKVEPDAPPTARQIRRRRTPPLAAVIPRPQGADPREERGDVSVGMGARPGSAVSNEHLSYAVRRGDRRERTERRQGDRRVATGPGRTGPDDRRRAGTDRREGDRRINPERRAPMPGSQETPPEAMAPPVAAPPPEASAPAAPPHVPEPTPAPAAAPPTAAAPPEAERSLREIQALQREAERRVDSLEYREQVAEARLAVIEQREHEAMARLEALEAQERKRGRRPDDHDRGRDA